MADLAVGAFGDENTESAEGAVYVLNLAPKQFVVTNTSNSGAGSLRQAILSANATSGLDLITFNIPGAGPHTISPTSALPTITDRVIIDGTSEPNFVSTPVVVLNCTSGGALANGLKITAGGSTVKGLAINRFLGHGIELRTGGGNVIERNFIGTSVGGTADQGNALDGVLIVNSAGNTVGGTTTAKRNVISGNNRYGVEIINSTSTGNVVQGNFIGTNAAGTGALGNSLRGVLVSGALSNSIGGTAAGAGNKIAFNGQNFVRVTGTATSNRILRNSIFTNTGIGIDLNGNGATANDTNDSDTGPNKRQNFPVMTSAVLSGANRNITYSVPSIAPNSTFPIRVEFFIADSANQEGQTFLGSHSYTSSGVKVATIPAGSAVLGTKIVATATDTNGTGNTSEVSANRTVASSLLAAGGAAPTGTGAASQTSAQLRPVVDSALARLTAQGLTATQVNQLSSVTVDKSMNAAQSGGGPFVARRAVLTPDLVPRSTVLNAGNAAPLTSHTDLCLDRLFAALADGVIKDAGDLLTLL